MRATARGTDAAALRTALESCPALSRRACCRVPIRHLSHKPRAPSRRARCLARCRRRPGRAASPDPPALVPVEVRPVPPSHCRTARIADRGAGARSRVDRAQDFPSPRSAASARRQSRRPPAMQLPPRAGPASPHFRDVSHRASGTPDRQRRAVASAASGFAPCCDAARGPGQNTRRDAAAAKASKSPGGEARQLTPRNRSRAQFGRARRAIKAAADRKPPLGRQTLDMPLRQSPTSGPRRRAPAGATLVVANRSTDRAVAVLCRLRGGRAPAWAIRLSGPRPAHSAEAARRHDGPRAASRGSDSMTSTARSAIRLGHCRGSRKKSLAGSSVKLRPRPAR